jgi:hypothetical protein
MATPQLDQRPSLPASGVTLAWLLATAALAAAVVASASAAPTTTVPGVVYVAKVTVTDRSIVIAKNKFSLHSKYRRYPRGAIIRYAITNTGTRPYEFKIWRSISKVVKPHGGHATLLINWSYRGRFPYETLSRSRPVGPHGYVTIF